MTINDLNKIDHREKRAENGKFYVVNRYDVTDNYFVTVASTFNKDMELEYRNIRVVENPNERYVPEIYYEEDIFGEYDPHFSIQTTAYGVMSANEIERVIAGYREAQEAVRILTEVFIED